MACATTDYYSGSHFVNGVSTEMRNEIPTLAFVLKALIILCFVCWMAVGFWSLQHEMLLSGMLAFFCAYIVGKDILF